jgi:hypothetical protein
MVLDQSEGFKPLPLGKTSVYYVEDMQLDAVKVRVEINCAPNYGMDLFEC